MKRRFVIAVEGFDEDQERRFKDHIAKLGSWWHWIDNLWLLTTNRDEADVEGIRDYAMELAAHVRVVVFEFPEDISWAASRSRNSKGKQMTEWLVSPWGDP